MLAYHLGVEVECKIAEAIDPRHYQTGFHATATCGTFAAAAAGAKLMGLDAEATARALSIAGSQSAGLRENFGTMTKPFHAGRAVRERRRRGAVRRATAGPRPTRSWKRRAASSAPPAAATTQSAIVGKLGAPWTFAEPGISIKPHPSGSLTHPGMTEMLRLIGENGIRAADVKRVRVGTNSEHAERAHPSPAEGTNCRPSSRWSSAWRSCSSRAAPVSTSSPTRWCCGPDVQAMIEKVDFVVDDEAERAGYHKMTTIIDIELMTAGRFPAAPISARAAPRIR